MGTIIVGMIVLCVIGLVVRSTVNPSNAAAAAAIAADSAT